MDKDRKGAGVAFLLRQAFNKHGRGFMTFKTLLSLLDKNSLERLGLEPASNQAKVRAALSALKTPYHIRKYGPSEVLFNAPLENVALTYIREKKGKTFAQLNKDFPVITSVFLDIVNGLLEREELTVRLSSTAKPILYPSKRKKIQTALVSEKQTPSRERYQDAPTDSFSITDFKRAYDAVGKGADYVFIHRIRRHLGWPRTRFDERLYQMMVDGYLAAHPGNPSELSADEVADSFTDEFGDLYITVTWRKSP